MSELSILNQLVAAGMTPVGACAMAGNMQAESALRANNAQDGMTKLSDEEYTKAANARTIDFAHDGVGYGLCQWTYPTRKAALLEFAYDCLANVGDEAMQVQFCITELETDYPELWAHLCETQDLYGATGKICTEYERPAVNNIAERARYANEMYMRYGAEIETMSQVNRTDEESNRTRAIKNAQCAIKMPTIKRGDRSPEARYLADKLTALGYNVLWDGLWACVVDYQQKSGLTVDGICGEQTWKAIMQEGK